MFDHHQMTRQIDAAYHLALSIPRARTESREEVPSAEDRSRRDRALATENRTSQPSMLFNWNHREIRKRGAVVDNADFVFWKCSKCGAFALYEQETMLLYLDPSMQASALAGIRGEPDPPCRVCGAIESFQEADASAAERIVASDWRFAVSLE
jgi:hypothetical protein